jgi:hypothetical protein
MVLIAMLVGSMLIPVTLSFMDTGIKAGQVIEYKTNMLYVADSGIEDAIWQIKQSPADSNKVPSLINDTRTYTISDIDSSGSDVTIKIRLIASTQPLDKTYEITSTAASDGGDQMVEKAIVSMPYDNLNVFSGALVSSGDISLKKDATVSGDIMCKGSFSYKEPFTQPSGGWIDGDDEESEYLNFPSDSENAAFAAKFKAEAKAGGTVTGNVTLGTGSYGPKYITGNLKVSAGATVTLTGTIYVEGTIDVGKDGNFIGSGNIVAVGDIGLEKTVGYGTDGESIIYSVNGSIDFRKECDATALIYAPKGNISFKKEATINGSVVCGGEMTISDITADKEFSITYNPDYMDTMELPGFEAGSVVVKAWVIG